MSNNADLFVAQVKKDIIDKFRQNAQGLDRKIDQLQQQTIEDFEAVDSGYMQLKTFTKFQVNFSSNIIAEATFNTRGVNYAQYVIDGGGTNKDYGQRNYLETARDQTLDLLTKDSYTRVFKRGSPNKGKNRIGKRQF
jgi:hypothetical protein